jgi:hypothetical protein
MLWVGLAAPKTLYFVGVQTLICLLIMDVIQIFYHKYLSLGCNQPFVLYWQNFAKKEKKN